MINFLKVSLDWKFIVSILINHDLCIVYLEYMPSLLI